MTDKQPDRNPQGHFLPGNRISKLGGRPKGSRNVATMTFKLALIESFWQAGGVAYLVDMAKNQPELYQRLLLRLLPQELAAAEDESNNPIAHDPDADLDD